MATYIIAKQHRKGNGSNNSRTIGGSGKRPWAFSGRPIRKPEKSVHGISGKIPYAGRPDGMGIGRQSLPFLTGPKRSL